MLSLITYDSLPVYTDWNANNPILEKRDCTKVFFQMFIEKIKDCDAIRLVTKNNRKLNNRVGNEKKYGRI